MKRAINQYIKDNTFLWNQNQQDQFRQLYYKLFLDQFGLSRKCWHTAILKVYNSPEYKSLLTNKL